MWPTHLSRRLFHERLDPSTRKIGRRERYGPTRQAGCGTARRTGASTIGRLISADSTPNRMESHQIGVYEPNFSNTIPPSHTPRKPPTWWLTNANPYSVANQRVPNI